MQGRKLPNSLTTYALGSGGDGAGLSGLGCGGSAGTAGHSGSLLNNSSRQAIRKATDSLTLRDRRWTVWAWVCGGGSGGVSQVRWGTLGTVPNPATAEQQSNKAINSLIFKDRSWTGLGLGVRGGPG